MIFCATPNIYDELAEFFFCFRFWHPIRFLRLENSPCVTYRSYSIHVYVRAGPKNVLIIRVLQVSKHVSAYDAYTLRSRIEIADFAAGKMLVRVRRIWRRLSRYTLRLLTRRIRVELSVINILRGNGCRVLDERQDFSSVLGRWSEKGKRVRWNWIFLASKIKRTRGGRSMYSSIGVEYFRRDLRPKSPIYTLT